MNNKNPRIVIEDRQNDFLFKRDKSCLEISFNRIAFVFFIFLIISLVYSIHLIHLGSRKINHEIKDHKIQSSNKLYRADIVDRNGRYISKTINSIDIGLSPKKIIDQKKLIINLKYIFPNKDFKEVKERIKKGNFFYFEKKVSYDNYEKLMRLGDKSIEPKDNLIRIYPQKNLFGHIIGQIDDQNNGISGLEKSLDEILKKKKNR